jgi:hypothetical protein
VAIHTALRDERDLLGILSSVGMEKYFGKQDFAGWYEMSSYEDTMEFLYNAMESGSYESLSGYMYHVNRTFTLDFQSVNFFWNHGIIEFDMLNVHMNLRRCQEISVLIEEDYSMLFYFKYGKGSSCAIRLLLPEF